MNLIPMLAKDPMFSSGQIYFGIVFFIIFSIIILFIYIKDWVLHRKNYKGVFWILLGFITFILLLVTIKLGLEK